MSKSKRHGGHPAKQDPVIDKLFRTMRASVELVRDLDSRLTEEQLDYLKGVSAGLMFTYSELTGMPNPIDIIFKEITSAPSTKPALGVAA